MRPPHLPYHHDRTLFSWCRRLLLLGGALAFGLPALLQPALAARAQQPIGRVYHLTDLTAVLGVELGATEVRVTDINALGELTGYFTNTAGESEAFLLDKDDDRDDVVRRLGTLPGRDGSWAAALNDDGWVAGDAFRWIDRDRRVIETRAFVWDGSMMRALGNLAPAGYSQGRAINRHGHVVGHSSTDVYPGGPHAVRWRDTSPEDLGTLAPPGGLSDRSEAFGINDSGHVTGDDYGHAFRWDGTMRALLPAWGPENFFSYGAAINNAGTIAGGLNNFAVIWRDMTPEFLENTWVGNASGAHDINDRGEVVGWASTGSGLRGFVWDGTTLADLNDLLDRGQDEACQNGSTRAWTVTRARRINMVGQIVADAAHCVLGPRQVLLDPLPLEQWHLDARSDTPGAANVRTTWEATKGQGVTVAIIDSGIEWTHPDLLPNYDPASSYDFRNNAANPSPDDPSSSHGTQVAGVAAAYGVTAAGVAPRAKLADLRILGPGTVTSRDMREAGALNYLPQVIDIANNSWGGQDGPAHLERPGPLAANAIESAIRDGRRGLGRIFVWAAGNGAEEGDNCNFDGYANSRFGMAVGAVTESGTHATYSESCSALFVVAPSSGGPRQITTTYLFGTYTTGFRDTSAATPVVSGTVALMLHQNPTLTWRDVQHVLRLSSYRVNPDDPGWTDGPFPHSEKYGFGQVDAHAAARMAAIWTGVPREVALPEVSRIFAQPRSIPDNSSFGVIDEVTIGPAESNFVIEHVEVDFTATHAHRGQLRVTLTAPDGVESVLGTRREDPGDDFDSWRFMSVRHWGRSPVGPWTLRVEDTAAGVNGTFDGWKLRIYGYRRIFTDDPLVAGQTTVKAVHFTELRFRINAARAGCGLGPVEWTPIVAGASLVRAVHVAELRTALNEAYRECGLDPPSFADPVLLPGVTPLRLIHLTELRTAVNGLE